mmetsp:Transcript_436/g.823  ORF Transcript_436/g.823 Transcript_436/m.823 type:complete len:89 (+) Transcript_436:453-719(+)
MMISCKIEILMMFVVQSEYSGTLTEVKRDLQNGTFDKSRYIPEPTVLEEGVASPLVPRGTNLDTGLHSSIGKRNNSVLDAIPSSPKGG